MKKLKLSTRHEVLKKIAKMFETNLEKINVGEEQQIEHQGTMCHARLVFIKTNKSKKILGYIAKEQFIPLN